MYKISIDLTILFFSSHNKLIHLLPMMIYFCIFFYKGASSAIYGASLFMEEYNSAQLIWSFSRAQRTAPSGMSSFFVKIWLISKKNW